MATIAGDTSVYNAQTDWENERKYLSGLAKGGNTWAVDQLSALSEAEKMYTQPKKPVAPSVNISTPVQDRSALIEQLYKAQQDAAIAELDAAYNQNVIDLDAAKNKIPGVYAAQRNRTASDAAVNQRNFGEFAAASGLGSGANAQARLAMNNQLTSGLSSIAQAEADALAEIETERARVQAKYKADVAAAIAEGNAAKAQALYAEAVRVDEMLQQQAVQNAQLALQQAELERALYNDEYERSLLEAKKTSNTGGIQPTPKNIYDEMRAKGIADEANAYAYLVGKGYSSTEAENIAYYYMGIEPPKSTAGLNQYYLSKVQSMVDSGDVSGAQTYLAKVGADPQTALSADGALDIARYFGWEQ